MIHSDFFCTPSLILVSCVLQIILVSSKRTGLIVVLKLAMCLQIRGDFPSHCFGTIRYIPLNNLAERRLDAPVCIFRQILSTDFNYYLKAIRKTVLTVGFKQSSSHFILCCGEYTDAVEQNEQTEKYMYLQYLRMFS